MSDDTMLPEDDRDRSLARRLGDLLDQRAPLDEKLGDDKMMEASFEQALLAYKKAPRDDTPSAGMSVRIWDALEQQMTPAEAARKPTPRTPLRLIRSLSSPSSARAWLAAASVLFVAVVGWLLWARAPQPTLVADATTDIVTYTTSDGSVVQLRPHSQLYVLDEDNAAYRLVGEGFFDVARDETRTFSVEAGNGRIAVLGTRFNVSTWGTRTTVYLEQGQVRFERLDSGQAVILAPGQQSVLTADGRLAAPTSVDSTEFIDWLDQELRFEQSLLPRVLDELNHHYAVTVEIPPALENETVTGRVLLGQIDQSLSDLGNILNGRFVEVNDSTYRFIQQ